MKLTVAGKLALFLIALGVALGGWKAYQSRLGGASPTTNRTATNTPGTQTTNTTSATTAPVNAPLATNEIALLTNPGKRGWLDKQIDDFNAQSDIKIKSQFLPTREAMQAMLNKNNHPALWSPSAVIWADRLAQVKGANIIDTSNPDSYRVVLRSPLVFLTTKEKARFLKPLLSGNDCWKNLEALSTGKKKAPWGPLKWAHADPLQSNTGTITLALIIADYAGRTGQGAAIEKLPNDRAFLDYFKRLEKSAVYDSAVKKGSTALIKSFASDPSRYDFITAYEAQAMSSVADNADLAVIYPSPTVNAESAVAFLDWGDATPEQKTTAQNFLKFVAGPGPAADGVGERYRPVRGASLTADLNKYAANGFQVNYSSIELPPYGALNGLAYKWSKEIAGQ